ncbi:MAG: Trm112 family protein [Pseudomonadota bacterium]
MPGPESLLDILCCPVSHEPLRPLGSARLKKLNQAIEKNELQYVNDDPVEAPLKSALITRDGNVVYAVEQSIPVLLPDRGIGTVQLENF